jgi:hypothetical protein
MQEQAKDGRALHHHAPFDLISYHFGIRKSGLAKKDDGLEADRPAVT